MPDERVDPDPSSPIVYMALSILCSSQNSLVPEILYVLKPDQIINFIKVFGGETLRVPTKEEFGRDMMAAIACYHNLVEGKSFDWVALTYNLDGNYMRSIKNRLEDWLKDLSPGEKDFIETLRRHEERRKKERSLRDNEPVIEWL